MKASDIQVGAKLVRVLFDDDRENGARGFLRERVYDVVEVVRGSSAVFAATLQPEGMSAHRYRYTGVEVALEFEVAGSAGHKDRRRALLRDAIDGTEAEVNDLEAGIAAMRAQLEQENPSDAVPANSRRP
jgi:hypothetical protein